MKYKIGDIVRIRTWKDMERKYGLNEEGNIDFKYKHERYPSIFKRSREEWMRKIGTREFTIKIINEFSQYYVIEEGDIWGWTDEMIEGYACLCRSYYRRTGLHVEDCPLYFKPDFIETRFEILDIR